MLALALACVAAVVSARAVVEVDAKGGYGNQLFEFASCRALALRAGAAFRADTQGKYAGVCLTHDHIEGCGLPKPAAYRTVPLKGSRSWWDGRRHESEVQTVRRSINTNSLFQCSGYRQSASYFANVPSVSTTIRGELGRFTETIMARAEALWETSIKPVGEELSAGDVKYVALYHRRGRGDAYSSTERKNPYRFCLPGEDFYKNAVMAFRERYSSSGIVYVTSSYHRVDENDMLSRAVALDPLARLVAIDDPDAVVVLATFAKCDAATFSHGTFSWFVSFLTGGPVYYDPRPWLSRGCRPLSTKYHLNDARVSLQQHVPKSWLPLASAPVTKTCAYPPRFREAWFYAFGKRKNEATNIELLAFASRFSSSELAVGFNTKYFGRGRVAGANYTEVASREFWVRRGEEDYVRSLPVQQDHHRHTLVVRFPLNATDGPEVVRIRVGKEGAEKWLRLSEVEVCDERRKPATLALCTSVLGKDLVGHPDHARRRCGNRVALHAIYATSYCTQVVVWLGYHFAQGVDRATVYVDVDPGTTDAAWELLIKPALARLGADADRVTFLPWRFREKNFWSQQIAQNHCIYKARGAGTRAVISTDIDEFMEPQTANQRVVDVVLATVIDRGLAAWRIVMRAVALERTTKRQTNIGDLYAKHNGRASGPLWSAKIGRGNRVGGTKSTAKLALDPSLVDYISVHQVTGARGAVLSSWKETGLIMNHVRHHDHGPGAKPSGGALPTCLARPWAAAWALYVAHASTQGYAAHLVPRPCAEKLSGNCLPAACAD